MKKMLYICAMSALISGYTTATHTAATHAATKRNTAPTQQLRLIQKLKRTIASALQDFDAAENIRNFKDREKLQNQSIARIYQALDDLYVYGRDHSDSKRTRAKEKAGDELLYKGVDAVIRSNIIKDEDTRRWFKNKAAWNISSEGRDDD